MESPVRLDTKRAIKSVPPVEAFPRRAMTIALPKMTPPKITFSTSSVKMGLKLNICRKILLKNTWTRENIVKRMLIPLQHRIATGIFSKSMVTCMGILSPFNSPSRSTSMAMPVNPPDMIPAGRTKTCSA